MLASLASQPGDASKPNEDWCLATPTFAVVLDGVSSPAGTDASGCRHGTPWYVQQLGSTLVRYASIETLPLDEMLANAIADVRSCHNITCDVDSPNTPAATVVMLRETAATYDYLVLSDSTLVLDVDDGLVVVGNPPADSVVPEERQRVFEHSPGSPEHAEALARMVAAQRKLRNRDGGYWVAAADVEAAWHAKTGFVNSDSLGSALAVTDGVGRLHEWGLLGWDNMLGIARKYGVERLIAMVREVETAGDVGAKYPQFRSSDDASAVFVRPDTPLHGR